MKIVSFERQTGKGARHETQLWDGYSWWPVSEMTAAIRVGREDGYHVWEIDLPDVRPDEVRAYHRSNSGKVSIVAAAEAVAGGESRALPE